MQVHAPPARRLTICGLTELGAFQNAAVTHVLSILDPGHPEPEDFAAYGPHKRLTLRFDDIITPLPGMALPESHHIEALLEFGKGLAAASDDPLNHLLVHCHAGISRSTASMTLILAQALPQVPAPSILEEVLRIREKAWPNLRMIEIGDAMLGRGGALVAAAHDVYRRQVERRPFLWDFMTNARRERELGTATKPQTDQNGATR
jgi:predicted protein tyrosine phosphatase